MGYFHCECFHSLYSSTSVILPAGMVARQLLSTFMANSATAAGVRTSSHAGEERRRLQPTSQKTKQEEIRLLCKKEWHPTFSAAGHGALEGARD